MAVTNQTISQLSTSLFTDTANAATAVAVKASSTIVSYVQIDNSANAAVTYVKLYNVAVGSVTVGTTAPDHIFYVPASVVKNFVFPDTVTFATALTVASVTAGGTAGTSPPSTPITVRIAYT